MALVTRRSFGFGIRFIILVVVIVTITLAVYGRGIAQEPSRAGIVIRLSESETISKCVAFEDEDISGLELLERSGLTTQIRAEGMGSLVCSINETGCPANDCFCQCKGGGECVYWSYWQESAEGWQYARLGAGSYRVTAGEMDGWSWGPGSLTDAIAPPEITFEEICSEDAATTHTIQVQDTGQTVSRETLLIILATALLLVGMAAIVMRRRRNS